jgi:protein-disulfide isomerase
MKKSAPLLIIVGVLVAALIVGLIFYRSAQTENSTGTNETKNASNSAALRLPPGAEPPHVRGNPNASVIIEEFADFQCPQCGRVYPVVKKIESDYGSRIGVIFRNRPLTDLHRNALAAAHAAEAAGLQNAFWEMHDALYEKQAEWSNAFDPRQLFAGYARQLGLDADRLLRDMDSTPVANRIIQDGRRADALRVNGTPTFFINGVEPTDMSNAGLRAAIDGALQKAENKK